MNWYPWRWPVTLKGEMWDRGKIGRHSWLSGKVVLQCV